MRTAYKFLAPGAVSPFTGFRWPEVGTWVAAAPERDQAWVFACRRDDLPYWLDRELWRIELQEPVREGPHPLSAARARLAERIEAWNAVARRGYAEACSRRARDLALPALPPEWRERIARLDDPAELAAAAQGTAAPPAAAGYLADSSALARGGDAAAASYMTCMLATVVSGSAAAFEGERAWQARWLSEHLSLDT